MYGKLCADIRIWTSLHGYPYIKMMKEPTQNIDTLIYEYTQLDIKTHKGLMKRPKFLNIDVLTIDLERSRLGDFVGDFHEV